jgi:ribosomal protein S18 acetylase RimI-like enzyme
MESVALEAFEASALPEVAAVLGRAFAYRGVYRVGSPESRSREERFSALFKLMVGHLPGQAIVARRGGRVVGALRMVEWPRCQVSPSQGFRLLPVMINIQRAATLRWLMTRYLWWRHDPRKPHFHIDPLGVDPDSQGQGTGSQLLARFCDIVDSRSMGGYLETDTPANVRLYERFGFVIVGQSSVLNRTDWFMWRAATSCPGYAG